MLFPSIFGHNAGTGSEDFLLPDIWGFDPFAECFIEPFHTNRIMKTDVKTSDDNLELTTELPGLVKEDIALTLQDGYLCIQAEKKEEKDKKDDHGKIIRKERYEGSMSRSFYVGKNITEEDVRAKFENGVLTLTIRKQDEKPSADKKQIAIEG